MQCGITFNNYLSITMKTTIKFKKVKIDQNGCHLLIRMKLNRKTVWLVLDTGASQTVLDYHVANSLSKNKALKMDRASSRGVGGEHLQSHLLMVEEASLGDLVIYDYHFVLLDLQHVNSMYQSIGIQPVQGVLGSDLLNRYKAVIDFKKKELVLTFNKAHKRKST